MQGEALQYKRELLEERSKSKALQVADKASKAAAERAEEELHSLRKQNAAQLNDAKDNKGELWKQMMQTKEQSEKKHKNLTEQLTDTQSALEAANSRCQNAVGHASMLEGEKINIKSKVRAHGSLLCCVGSPDLPPPYWFYPPAESQPSCNVPKLWEHARDCSPIKPV